MKHVKTVICVFLLLACLPPSAAVASDDDNVYGLIERGEFNRARELLSDASTATLRDGNRLFFLSLLEPAADKAVRLMEAALQASVSPRYQEVIYVRLAEYYLLVGNGAQLAKLVTDYRTRWEGGKYRDHILRLLVVIDESEGAYESAIRRADRNLLEYGDGHASHWGIIDKARVMAAFNKEVGARSLLRRLSREKSGPGVPQALYLLTSQAISDRRADDAVFYYNILREEFPSAVGLDALTDRMANMSTPDLEDAAAEKVTGTFYSIQVGVFSEEDNARRQAQTFAMYGKNVDIRKKLISGKEYRVVYVGKFDTYLDAQTFKQMLEDKHNEVFQVVAR